MCGHVLMQVIVTVNKKGHEAQALKELMHRQSPDVVREKIAEYLRCLKEGLSCPQTFAYPLL